MSFNIGDMSASALGISGNNVRVDTQDRASASIGAIDKAIEKVSKQRSTLGAVQNRLEHTIANLDTSAENLQQAESRVRDVDMAKEMVEYSKYNILSQASQQSAESVETTVSALNQIKENLTVIVEGNVENRKRLQDINESLTNIAATSEEISSSMSEVENQAAQLDEKASDMVQDVEGIKSVSNGLEAVVKPLITIEECLKTTNRDMGQLALDTFYMPSNGVFIENVEKAINAHKNWLEKLEHMIEDGKVEPIQTDAHRCAFGHFYYAMQPKNPEIFKIWSEVREQHKEFHKNGERAIAALKAGNKGKAEEYYKHAVELSEKLLSDFEEMVRLAKRLDKEQIRIFE